MTLTYYLHNDLDILPCYLHDNLQIVSVYVCLFRDISLTMGGGRHVRQNSSAIFGDPPYRIGTEISDPPYLMGLDFVIPPLPRLHTNLHNRLKKAKRHRRENFEDFNA